LLGQQEDPDCAKWRSQGPPEKVRENPGDGIWEREAESEPEGHPRWVPYIPVGEVGLHTSWRYWVFFQSHVGVFGGHRLAPQTLHILRRIVWWPSMKSDVEEWVKECLTCIRFRKRPMKQEAVAVKPRPLECWQEVMVDVEGPSNPADRQGNRYVMTYICCLCHGVLLEPCKDLTFSEVRRAFGRCLFRSGTLPNIIRSDRGVEFRSTLIKEYLALIGARQRYGTPWRPMEQGIVERSHQELQKILGMLVSDVLRSYRSEWTELLVVVEFLIYTTPAAYGYTPRDLDRRWSLALPLEKELAPFAVHDYEPLDSYAKGLFRAYREMRAKVVGWQAATSEKRAELANRWR
ncbi:MAG: transposase family protein, partial [bacterium]|nr:transposase family protein [bacterium]